MDGDNPGYLLRRAKARHPAHGILLSGNREIRDLPPRPECAPAWRNLLLDRLPHIGLTLVIGQYAHAWHLDNSRKSVTANVEHWQDYWPEVLPMPHPSPRNNLWLRRNSWFESEVVPELQKRVAQLLEPEP